MEHQISTKRSYLLVVSLFSGITVFLLYLSMLPSEYTTANFGTDGGDLLTAVLVGGIPHPTGYPTYLLLGRLFQTLPFSTPFFKGALMSGIFASATAGIVCFYFGSSIIDDHHPYLKGTISFVSAVALGVSPLLWSQAVIVEVYALANFFITCGLLWMSYLLNNSIDKNEKWGLGLLSMVIGIGFGNHLMLGLLIPAFIYASSNAIRKGKHPKSVLAYIFVMVASAALVYLILPLRARGYPPVNWGNPQTLEGFIWLVSGKLYQGLSFQLPLKEVLSRVFFFFSSLIEQFGIVGLLIGLIGAVRVTSSENKLKWIYLWVFIIFPLFSIGYLTNDSIVYTIPSFVIFAVWIGNGLVELWDKLESKSKWIPISIIIGFSLLIAFRVTGQYQELDPRKDTSAKNFAEDCLHTLPANAIILTKEDIDTFPLWFYHFGLDQRPDIKVIAAPLLEFDWYRETISHIYPDIIYSEKETLNLIEQFAVLNPRNSVCHSQIDAGVTTKAYCVCP